MAERELNVRLIGYARVSIEHQNLELQLSALEKAGCKRAFTDKTNGAHSERPGLREALPHLREADTLVVWKLDRLGRSVKGLLDLVNELKSRHAHFKSLTDGIDTKTQLVEHPMQMDPHTGVLPGSKVMVDRATRRKFTWQQSPLAACPQEVKDGVEDGTKVGGARSPDWPRRWQNRANAGPSRVGQVGVVESSIHRTVPVAWVSASSR
jgi:hypothetical protein